GVHRRNDVHEHPHAEEGLESLVAEAGQLRDLAPQPAELAPGDLADLVVVAGGIGLQLQQQLVAVTEQLAVALPHAGKRVLTGRVTDSTDEGLPDPLETVLDE